MKEKKIILIIIIAVISLLVVGLLIYEILQSNMNFGVENSIDSNPPEAIIPSESVTEKEETEGIVPPITPTDPLEKTDKREKAEIEFDIGDYKPTHKDPEVEDVKVEYGTKEVEPNA